MDADGFHGKTCEDGCKDAASLGIFRAYDVHHNVESFQMIFWIFVPIVRFNHDRHLKPLWNQDKHDMQRKGAARLCIIQSVGVYVFTGRFGN